MLRKPDFGMIGDLPNHVGEIPVNRGVNIHIDAEAVQRTWMSRLCIVGQPEAPPERLVAILYMPMSGLLLDYGLLFRNQIREEVPTIPPESPLPLRPDGQRSLGCHMYGCPLESQRVLRED
jgi:hypothetical protein